jgi:hypothetical protein
LDGLTKEEILTKNDEENIPYTVVEHLITEWIMVGQRKVPKIISQWKSKDYTGALGVRLGIGRFSYKVPAGLYAIGNPKEGAPVLVTCNYKLTFDILRRDLEGRDLWILVLDTKGINVWCAAGKGTFSSRELIYQLEKWQVKKELKCRRIIVPQLGATSMEPHLVRRYSGVNVIYGPIRSKDIGAYIDNGMNADENMRTVTFNFNERLVLTPFETVVNLKYWVIAFAAALILNLITGKNNPIINSWLMSVPFILANILGSVFFPMMLPWLPFKYFSLNGTLIGLPLIGIIIANGDVLRLHPSILFRLGYGLIILLMIAWISFNFTGCTTYTSLSGVKREANILQPIVKIVGLISIIMMFLGMGVV